MPDNLTDSHTRLPLRIIVAALQPHLFERKELDKDHSLETD